MVILAIDPGTTQSAYVRFDTDTYLVQEKAKVHNRLLRDYLKSAQADILVLEEIKSYGMPMGETTIHTCFWTGRFIESWGKRFDLIGRKTVCSILCANARANDSNIRRRLIDLFGPSESMAIGKKVKPGPLYGFSGDMWSALAVAIAWNIKNEEEIRKLEEALV